MTRSRTKKSNDEIYELKAEIKDLKAVNKSLEIELRDIQKEFSPKVEKVKKSKSTTPDTDPTTVPTCIECNKGTLVKTELGVRALIICSSCGKRRTIKNG